MKTNRVSSFVAVTIVAGLLAASLPAPSRAEARVQSVHQNQLLDRHEAAIKVRARLVAPGKPAGAGNGSKIIAPLSVADGSAQTWKSFQANNPQNAGRSTVLAGMPDWVWCMLHFCWRQ